MHHTNHYGPLYSESGRIAEEARRREGDHLVGTPEEVYGNHVRNRPEYCKHCGFLYSDMSHKPDCPKEKTNERPAT